MWCAARDGPRHRIFIGERTVWNRWETRSSIKMVGSWRRRSGLVPRQSSSGGKQRLLGITKRGDKYLRKLLVHGARSITTRAERKPQPQDQWLNELRARRGKYRSYVAQANKTARIAWAIMARGEVYRAPTATLETQSRSYGLSSV